MAASIDDEQELVTARGELVGVVIGMRGDDLVVRDPLEGRQLLVPRDALAGREGRRWWLRPRPVRAAGGGPERYVHRGTLAEEWVAQQTPLGDELTVEGRDPTDWRRVSREWK